MTARRVVAGRVSGADTVVEDEAAPRVRAFRAIPGMVDALVWLHDGGEPLDRDLTLTAADVPAPGQVSFKVVTFPPDAVFAETTFDAAAAHEETAALTPDLAALFEPDGSGFHRTPTLDLVTVVSGHPLLVMGDGSSVPLHSGDTVVQCAGRHRWSNPGPGPAVISVVHVGLHSGGSQALEQPPDSPARSSTSD